MKIQITVPDELVQYLGKTRLENYLTKILDEVYQKLLNEGFEEDAFEFYKGNGLNN